MRAVSGTPRADGDVDLLIELERPSRISLIGLVELEHYLSDVLGVKVDLAIKRNLRKRIGERILSEVVPLCVTSFSTSGISRSSGT